MIRIFKKSPFRKSFPVTLSLLLSLATVSVSPGSQSVQAQSGSPTSNPSGSSIQFDPPPPPNQGEPDGRAQGGGRRGCGLTALVPTSKTVTQEIVWGLTTDDRPTLWFHLQRPKTVTTPVRTEFELQDSTGRSIYKTNTTATVPAGVLSVSLPATATPLQVDQSYRWSLNVYCNPDDVQFVRVHGSLRRVALPPTVERQITTASTPVEQAALYASNGIWFDALTTLGKHLRTTPTDRAAIATWTDLLKQANLSSAAAAPLISCCTPDR